MVSVVSTALDMIANKPLDCCLLEETSLGETRRKEMVREEFSKLIPKPLADGDSETTFFPMKIFPRNNPC